MIWTAPLRRVQCTSDPPRARPSWRSYPVHAEVRLPACTGDNAGDRGGLTEERRRGRIGSPARPARGSVGGWVREVRKRMSRNISGSRSFHASMHPLIVCSATGNGPQVSQSDDSGRRGDRCYEFASQILVDQALTNEDGATFSGSCPGMGARCACPP